MESTIGNLTILGEDTGERRQLAGETRTALQLLSRIVLALCVKSDVAICLRCRMHVSISTHRCVGPAGPEELRVS